MMLEHVEEASCFLFLAYGHLVYASGAQLLLRLQLLCSCDFLDTLSLSQLDLTSQSSRHF